MKISPAENISDFKKHTIAKRVALCIPNLAWQETNSNMRWNIVPYALCILAATIRDICEVEIIDANLDNLSCDDFAQCVKNGNYDLIGITVMMDQFAECGNIAAKHARAAAPESIIMMGGCYPTVNPDYALENKDLDYIFIGEGEEVFKEFLHHIWNGSPFPLKGVSFRNADGSLNITPAAPFIKDLNTVPLPAYDLIDFPRYANQMTRKSTSDPIAYPYAHILTSRGCPQGCCFCQVKRISGNKFRPRSVENILEEMKYLIDIYGVRSFLFDDDNIVTQRSRAIKLFQSMIDNHCDLPWKALNMAVFKLDKELISLMAKSGCKAFTIAIESGSERVLTEIIKKPIDLEYAKEMVEFAKSCGIHVSANYILGFPTETWEEIRTTISVAEMLNADYSRFFAAIPLRHTRLWEMCEELDIFREGFSIKTISWNEGQITSKHFNSKELTILRTYEWDRINFSTPEKIQKICEMMNVTEEELIAIRHETRKNALERLSK